MTRVVNRMNSRQSRGAAMLLVLIAVAMATILALSFLASQGPTAVVASNIDRKAKARQIAESALKMAIDYVNEDADWRTDKSSGTWMTDASLDGGTFTLTGIDEADGDLANDDSQMVTLSVVATYQGVTHRVSARVTPGAEETTANRLLLVVGNSGSPSSQDSAKQTLFESWGYTVTLIDDNASQASFDAAVAINDVVYISEECSATGVDDAFADAAIGVVNEERRLDDEFGFTGSDSTGHDDGTTIVISDNTHTITTGFSTGSLAIYTTSAEVIELSGSTPASGVQVLAEESCCGSDGSLMVAETGATLYTGAAAARRVMLPSGGDFDINDLTADGTTIWQRSIEWAAGGSAGGGSVPTLLALYEFNEVAVAAPTLVGHWKLDESGGGGTFGETAPGSNSTVNDDDQVASKFTIVSAMTVSSLSAYVDGGDDGGLIRMAIYDHDAVGDEPGDLLRETSNISVSEETWEWATGSITSITLSPGTYWLALAMDSSDNDMRYSYDSGGETQQQANSGTDNGFDSNWDDTFDEGTWSRTISIYASGGSSSATDETGTGNDGTYQGDAVGGAGGFGDGGTAADFDGTGDYVEIPHDASYMLNQGTVSMHFYPTSVTGIGPLFSKDATGQGNGGHVYIYRNGTRICAKIETTSDDPYGTGATIWLQSGTGVVSGSTWNHVVLTWGDGQVRLYLDGVLMDSANHLGGLGTTSGGTGNEEPIVIGGNSHNSTAGSATPLDTDFFEGRIDDVRIYDLPLDATQAANVAGGSAPGARTAPGYVAADTSGYGTAADMVIYDTSAISWPGGGGLTFTGDTLATTVGSATKLHDAIEANGEFAVELLITRATPGGTYSPSHIVGYTSASSTHNFLIGQDGTNYEARVRDSATGTSGVLSPEFISTTDLNASGDTHVVLSYSGGDVTVYIDGTLDETNSAGGTLNNWDDLLLVLGGAYTSGSNWRGTIKRLAIYDEAFNTSQANNVYNGNDPGDGSGSGAGTAVWDEED